jgi:hypothetical protein
LPELAPFELLVLGVPEVDEQNRRTVVCEYENDLDEDWDDCELPDDPLDELFWAEELLPLADLVVMMIPLAA